MNDGSSRRLRISLFEISNLRIFQHCIEKSGLALSRFMVLLRIKMFLGDSRKVNGLVGKSPKKPYL